MFGRGIEGNKKMEKFAEENAKSMMELLDIEYNSAIDKVLEVVNKYKHEEGLEDAIENLKRGEKA